MRNAHVAFLKLAIFSNKFRRLICMNYLSGSLKAFFFKALFAIALASFVQPAFASNDDGGQGDIAYSHISIFGHVGEGVLDAGFKGGIVRGSYAVGDHFFVVGDYAAQRTDDAIVLGPLSDKVTTEQGHLGVGFHTPIAAKTDFVVSSQYAVAIIELFGESITSEGVLIDVGVRTRIIDRWEFALGANYSNQVDQGEFGYSLSGRFYATPKFSLGLNFESVFDVEAYGALLRYDF